MKPLLQELWKDVRSPILVPVLAATLVEGMLFTVAGMSFAAYLFTGDLQSELPQGIIMMWYSMVIAGLVIGLPGHSLGNNTWRSDPHSHGAGGECGRGNGNVHLEIAFSLDCCR